MSLSEQDEFLLSQLLDGDLDQADAEALRARLSGEPSLREIFESLERVDRLVAAQRSRQPVVDSAALCRQVMAAVHAKRRPNVIRFPLWKWAGGALAAAAAIALLVTVYHPMGKGEGRVSGPIASNPRAIPAVPVPTLPTKTSVPVSASRTITANRMLVQFNRPASSRVTPPITQVSYAHSDQQAKAMHARDEEYRSRPIIRVVMAQRARPRTAAVANASPFDAPL